MDECGFVVKVDTRVDYHTLCLYILQTFAHVAYSVLSQEDSNDNVFDIHTGGS